jgi:hypothetical protein
MVLCTFCENISIEELAVDNLPQEERWTERAGHEHQPNWEALLRSAESCELCQLIRDVGKDDGSFPNFDPAFDEIPDQIARRKASQRLKLRAFRPGGPSESSPGLGLQGLQISNAQLLTVFLEIFADEGLYYDF